MLILIEHADGVAIGDDVSIGNEILGLNCNIINYKMA